MSYQSFGAATPEEEDLVRKEELQKQHLMVREYFKGRNTPGLPDWLIEEAKEKENVREQEDEKEK